MLIVEKLSDIVLNDSSSSVLLDLYGLKVPVWKKFATDSIATIYSG